MTTDTPKAGHNNPPDEFTDTQTMIDNLYDEAKNFLDGDPIDSEGLAEGVTDLLNQLRAAGKDAEALRVAEKKPFNDGANAVQAKFKPLSDKVTLATNTCKKALVPWLEKKEAAARAEQDRLQAEAEEAAAKAEELRKAAADNLEAQEELAQAEDDADKATAIAKKQNNASAGVKVGGHKAVSLRSTFIPEIIDPVKAVEHYWQTKQPRMKELLLQLANEDVRAGKREIPGFNIIEEKSAV